MEMLTSLWYIALTMPTDQLKHTTIVTYADGTVIFTSNSELSIIESHLYGDANKSLVYCINDAHRPIETYNDCDFADGTVIFTSNSELSIIDSHLYGDANNLANWFCKN